MENKPVVVTLYLSKGGVAKSTLAALLAEYLAASGFRTVLIDLDRQGSQSEIFDLVSDDGLASEVLHMVFKRRVDILSALTPIPNDRVPRIADRPPGALYVVQGGPQSKEAIDEILANPVRFKIANTLDIIRQPVLDLAGYADYVIMDMGPADQVSAIAGLVATDELIIPTMADFLSVSRIASVLEEVEVARQAKPDLRVLGIVPVMTRYYFGGLRKSRNVQVGEEFLNANYADLLLSDSRGMIDIPYNEAWRNVMWAGQSLLTADVSGKVRADALRFLNAVSAELGIDEVEHAG